MADRMRRIQVPLFDPSARRALVNLAERERRDPRDQAAVLILEGLKNRGLWDEAQRTAGTGLDGLLSAKTEDGE